MKTILIAVTGMSPQVITETLWAIHHEQGNWPAEIQLITTSRGGECALQGLLTQGHLQRLCMELGRPMPVFGQAQIHVVTGAGDRPVDDARSREDHEALADFIMGKVAELASDDSVRIHASLAGGRKTMTYYFGYALSLFGRDHDCLTHVLVSDGYENLPDFYYPSRSQPAIATRDGRSLMPADAVVVLADIPFVRLSDSLSPGMRELARRISFRQLVVLLNLAAQPAQIRVELEIRQQTLVVYSRDREQAVARIPLASRPTFALLWVLVEAHQEGEHAIQRRNLDTAGNESPDRGMALLIVEKLYHLCGQVLPAESSQLEQRVALLNDYAELNEPNLMRTLQTLASGATSGWLNPQISNIRKALKKDLPGPLAALLSPALMTVTADGGLEEAAKTDPEASYRFKLDAGQFSITSD